MKNNYLKFCNEYSLSMSDFLERFYGFSHDCFCSLTHDDLSNLLPDVSKVSSVCMEDILLGNAIVVKDCKGSFAFYSNPLLVDEDNFVLNSDNSLVCVSKVLSNGSDYSYVCDTDLVYMSNNELENALNYFKMVNNHRMVRLICDEFRFRPKKGCKKRKLEMQRKKERLEEEL